MAIVTLATDYGTVDGYAAALKGVIKRIAPEAEIIDVTHELDSIHKAAFAMKRYHAEYPQGTIHLMVIDPTVGTSRRALAGKASGRYYVGPDNGIFTFVIKEDMDFQWHQIDPEISQVRQVSRTFHGRDIFAPAAALLASGRELISLGREISDPVTFSIPEPVCDKREISGEIIDIDTFGNLIINIPCRVLGSVAPTVVLKAERIPFAATFADVPIGRPVAYAGSTGYIEIALNMGRAANFFGVAVGAKVIVEL
jgi:S-adenosylmethionine hydrolase